MVTSRELQTYIRNKPNQSMQLTVPTVRMLIALFGEDTPIERVMFLVNNGLTVKI